MRTRLSSRISASFKLYRTRPPYPQEVFALLRGLIADPQGVVIELGAGTGDLTAGLAPLGYRIEAVEPSPSMIEAGRLRMSRFPHVLWTQSCAENYPFEGPYAAVLAAESLHWMDWDVVFPKLVRELAPTGYLVMVIDRHFVGLPWEAQITALVARYSTNREYQSYDIVTELSERVLFEEAGRKQVVGAPFAQTIEDYVESFHSRNGLSRERMGNSADEFDRELHQLVEAGVSGNLVAARVSTLVVWGKPRVSGAGQASRADRQRARLARALH